MKKLLESLKRNSFPYIFLFPSTILIFFFLLFPIVNGIWVSFFEFRGALSIFVGIKNYLILFHESQFINNIILSLTYLAVIVVALPLAFLTSLVLTSGIKFFEKIRPIFFIPWVIAPVVSAIIFRSMVDPNYGIITILIERITGERVYFLADPTLSMLIVILHSAWRSFPVITLFLVSGILSIPREIFEAAEIDGVAGWRKLIHIILPLSKIYLFVALLLITAWTLQDAETVYALTGGGPGRATEVLAVRLMKEAFLYFNLGIGSALGNFLLLISTIFLIGYLILLRIR